MKNKLVIRPIAIKYGQKSYRWWSIQIKNGDGDGEWEIFSSEGYFNVYPRRPLAERAREIFKQSLCDK